MDNNTVVTPKYVGFKEAAQRLVSYMFNYNGRATRSEYWYGYLVIFLVETVIGIVLSILGVTNTTVTGIINVILCIPMIFLGIRRMHDLGKGGAWILISLIPLIGTIWYFVLCVKRGTGDNQYGPCADNA